MLADDDELSPDRDPFLKNMLEEERLRLVGWAEGRKEELQVFVEIRESELADEEGLDRVYENYLATLSAGERPQTRSHERRLFNGWRSSRENELAEWKKEMETLESELVDGQLIFDNARDRLVRLRGAEARDAGLLPPRRTQRVDVQGQDEEYPGTASLDPEGWMPFAQIKQWAQKKLVSGLSTKPTRLRDGRGVEKAVSKWSDILLETAKWLIREGLLTKDVCPVLAEQRAKRYLVHIEPTHSTNDRFKYPRRLSSGLSRIHRWTGMDGVRTAEGVRELQAR